MSTPARSDTWTMLLFGLLLLAGLVMTGLGIVEASHGGGYAALALGVIAVMIPACLYPILSTLRQGSGQTGSTEEILHALQTMNERLLISDTAKRIAFREKDRNALRQAIRQDIERGDYDQALALAHEMAQAYGYREEAEKVREEIAAARKAEVESKIDAAIARVDSIIEQHDWDAAFAEAAKVQRLFAESIRVGDLTNRVRQARERYKVELERRFLQAAEREDVDLAIELLKELDVYLSEAEAEPFRETARGVIGKKRENLGVQFKLAVQDHDWSLALKSGQQIIREFPNTKMADEVRGMMETLRQRAAEQQALRLSALPSAISSAGPVNLPGLSADQ